MQHTGISFVQNFSNENNYASDCVRQWFADGQRGMFDIWCIFDYSSNEKKAKKEHIDQALCIRTVYACKAAVAHFFWIKLKTTRYVFT